MKKKHKKIKIKRIILFIICCILLILCIYCGMRYGIKKGNSKIFSNTEKLEKIGYSKDEINSITSNKDYIDYALENKYDERFVLFIKEDQFDLSKLSDYYTYLNNNQDASISDVIYLVNNNITYSYNKKLKGIIGEKYFLNTRLERYINYSNSYPNLIAKDVVTNVNCNLDYDYYTNVADTDTSKGILLLANKYYKMDSEYNNDLVTMDSKYSRVAGAKLNSEAYEAFKKLSDAAASKGYTVVNQSAYRSYYTQLSIYNGYLSTNGQEWTDKWSARAGFSEHQTGLALDVATRDTQTLDEFGDTKEYTWMINNSYKYGFILRYTEKNKLQTGYGDEPWHYRYVGVDAATTIHNEGMTFDEYYAYYVIKK